MNFVVSTTAQAHNFDIAKELHRRGMLQKLLTAYPASKLAEKGFGELPAESYALPFLATQAFLRLSRKPHRDLQVEPYHKRAFGRWSANHLGSADVLLATSSTGLLAGRKAKAEGMTWICDRPCSHIQTQDGLLVEEYKRFGLTWPGIRREIIDIELQEYEEADIVLVASTFSRKSMESHGIDPKKMLTLTYGINLDKFYPEGSPDSNSFQVIFAGQKTLRKGVRYLIDAFAKVNHPKKKLLLVGADTPDLPILLDGADLTGVEFLPAVSQDRLRALFSASHVLVLPSVEDGFGLVMSQAMACGCPILASENTGAVDLFTPGLEGFVEPVRDVDAFASRLQELADDPDRRAAMGAAAQAKAKTIGGWEPYVDALFRRVEA